MSESLLSAVLNCSARSACLSVFNDFTWDEAYKMPPSIQEAWKAGKDLDKYKDTMGINEDKHDSACNSRSLVGAYAHNDRREQ